MKRILSLIASIAVAGCATAPPAPAYNPVFDHTPSTRSDPGSAEVTVALVAPGFSEEQFWTHVPPFTDFSASLAADFDELLSARGFLVKGPFTSHDEMVFPDKNGSDLVLVPNLELTVQISQPTRRRTELISSQVQLRGTATVSGKVNFWLLESLTGTRMWAKDLPVTRRTLTWEGETWFAGDNAWTIEDLYADQGFANAVAPELEALYANIMTAAWDYLDPDEVRLVKKQAEPVRKRAVATIGR